MIKKNLLKVIDELVPRSRAHPIDEIPGLKEKIHEKLNQGVTLAQVRKALVANGLKISLVKLRSFLGLKRIKNSEQNAETTI